MRLSLALLLLAGPAARAADPVPYLPAETDAVLTVQTRQVLESDLGKKVGADLLKELLDAYKPAAAAVRATGLDPHRDVETMTVGIGLKDATPSKPFSLIEGKFDAKKLEANLAAYQATHPELTAIKVGDKGAYKLAGAKPADTSYIAVLDDTKLVVAATEADLSGAFAAAGGRKAVISKELAALVANAKPSGPIFLRAWVKGRFDNLQLPNEKLKTAVRGVDWVTVAVGVTKDVGVTATLNTPSPAAAQTLAELVNGVVALVRLQIRAASEDQPELRPVYDLLKATTVAPNGKTVVAWGTVTGEAIEKALAAPPAPKAPPTVPPKKK
jgi:hypothetical protein